MMNEREFWKIVESTRREALEQRRRPDQDLMDLHEKTLAVALKRLPPGEVAAFDARFTELQYRAYRWDLWNAAYLFDGGCSDDGFIDFRSCLISLGREWYDRILAEPDELAEIIGRTDVPYMQSEGFQYVARKVYEELTGSDIPDPGLPHPGDPVGENTDPEDLELMRKRYPKLTAKLDEQGG